MQAVHGTHIIGDLTGCELGGLAFSEADLDPLRERVSRTIAECGLRELGAHYHFFEKDAVTAVVALSESHLSFHTWPETGYVSMDVFVCHYSGDQSEAAQSLFDSVAAMFQPEDIREQVLYR